MVKKMKLEITEAQLNALINIVDEFSAINGGGDDDRLRIKWVSLVDKMLAKNGLKRLYN